MAGHRLTPSLISLHLSSAPAENEDNNPLPRRLPRQQLERCIVRLP